MKELEAIYRKRKQQLLPIIFGFAALFVIFRVILPQWTGISEVQDLLNKKNEVIEAKESTLRVLNGIPIETVENNYNVVRTALPLQKDVVLIYTELTDVARATGVKLGGFSVKVGDVYSTKEATSKDKKTISGIPFLNILITVSGDSPNLKQFAEKMYESIPIIEIKNVEISKNDARYDVNFFYKPVVARPSNADSVALEPLNQQEISQIERLKTWMPSSLSSL